MEEGFGRDLGMDETGGRGRGETKGWHGKYVSRSTHDCTTAYGGWPRKIVVLASGQKPGQSSNFRWYIK